MSFAIAHFSLGAIISLMLYRIFSRGIENYIQYDIIVVTLGGVWAMIPDISLIYDSLDNFFKGFSCDIFFFHCILDTIDPDDSIIVSGLLFGLFLIIINLITFTSLKKIKE